MPSYANDTLTYDATAYNVSAMDFNAPMSADEFRAALEELNCSVYASADVLGISLRQAQRYAAGGDAIPMRTARHLRLLVFNIQSIRRLRRDNLKQLADLRSGKFSLHENRVNITPQVIARIEVQTAELEKLLTNHHSGLKPGIGDDA
mgnify:FL=1